jgi:uncharacterized protein YdhG (YjbR/CyaY superfamily)
MVTRNTSASRDVDAYLSRLPKESRVALEKVRQTVKSTVPDAIEVISYQIPTFKYQGRMLVSYAGFSAHCSFFPGTGPIVAHQSELKAFQTSKGTIRFTTDQPLPVSLIKKLVKTRVRLNEASQKRRETAKSKGSSKDRR